MYVHKTRRVVSAVLKPKTINGYGRFIAFNDNCDGWTSVNITSPSIPQTIAPYIEGDDTVECFPISQNISKVSHYALAVFPNIKDVYLFKTNGIVNLLSDSFGGLEDLEHIFVPTDKLTEYQTEYADMSYLDKFTALTSDYTWNVPLMTGQPKLSEELMNNYIAMLSSNQKNSITLINIPNGYTSFDLGTLGHLFDNTFPNLATVGCQNEILFLGQAKNATKTGAILEVE